MNAFDLLRDAVRSQFTERGLPLWLADIVAEHMHACAYFLTEPGKYNITESTYAVADAIGRYGDSRVSDKRNVRNA